MKKIQVLCLILSVLLLQNCDLPTNTFRPKSDFQMAKIPQKPDYSKPEFWAALPTKKDVADRTPSPQFPEKQSEATADVFFIYPTIYSGTKKGQTEWNAPVDDVAFNADVDSSAILHQATAFNAAGKIYAPRYRQAHIWVYFTKDTANANKAFELAYTDIKAAFEYYLVNCNEGRPIILAAHSQGTNHAERLLKEFFDKKPLQKRLVAAYLVGMPIAPDAFQNIFPCRNATETGCFCSWNTYADNYYPKNYLKKLYRAVATNPITWTTGDKYANYSENKGGVLPDYTIAPNLSDAKSHRGLLWIGKPNIKVPASLLLKKNWHVADYNLFWVNIRENAVQRVEAWKK